jgi:hypothetical protein
MTGGGRSAGRPLVDSVLAPRGPLAMDGGSAWGHSTLGKTKAVLDDGWWGVGRADGKSA